MLCNYKDTKNDGYIWQGFNKMIYLCGRVIWSNGKTQQTKEVRSFLYRYPLLYSSSSKIYYSIDYNHISCFSKHNLLSAGADHVYPIIIVYKPVVWLFSCDLRDISIRYLPAAHPIKRWMSCHNHVTYAHSSGIRGRIYEKSALSIPYSPLMDYYFYTFANEERAYSRVRLMVFLHCLHWWIDISTLLQMGNGHVTVYALLFFHRLH